jgi:biotin/methionine sulfoxide reductase
VLPATSTLERDDIGHSTRDSLMIAMRRVVPPPGEARDDYDIFAGIADRMGARDAFTEGRSVMDWLKKLYEQSRSRMAESGCDLPEFDVFWSRGGVRLPANDQPVVAFGSFRADPRAHPLGTPSGRIELHSKTIASFALPDCPGHPSWLEPREWLGSPRVAQYPLHMLSDQPYTKLHSQLDHSSYSLANKVDRREPIHIHPADAAARAIEDGALVRVFNDRGTCLAAARIDEALRPGVVKLSTGAWWDPVSPGEPDSIDRHGNPNTLTRDQGASSLSQGCAAQSCLVEVALWLGKVPDVQAFELPRLRALPPTESTST